MLSIPKKIIQKLANFMGYHIIKLSDSDPVIYKDKRFGKIYRKCRKFSMTSRERMYALYKSVEYIVNNDIPGDFVECGVWRGGNGMLIAYTLLELGIKDRKIFLYDTFGGMTQPTELDHGFADNDYCALEKWNKEQRKDHNKWCYASLTEVENNMHIKNTLKEM